MKKVDYRKNGEFFKMLKDSEAAKLIKLRLEKSKKGEMNYENKGKIRLFEKRVISTE